MSDDRREAGKARMRAVYGWDIEPTKPFEVQTVDHLFGEVWADGSLSVRDRRLVLIGLCAGTGQDDVAGLQLDAAVRLGELGVDDLRDLVVFLAHYAGWPRGAKLNTVVEELIGRLERDATTATDRSTDEGAAAKQAAVDADTDAGSV